MTLPVVVTSMLRVTLNAYFYAAWTLANFMFIIPAARAFALFTVGAAAPSELMRKIRFTLWLAVMLGLTATIGLTLGADCNLRVGSVAGLYFIGITSLSSCGPLFRCVAGTKATAQRVAGAVVSQV